MGDTLYSAGDILDKTLVAKRKLAIYNGVPDASYIPVIVGDIEGGKVVGRVYSYIAADPYKGRAELWWMFWPSTDGGKYYYAPHVEGDFDLRLLEQQGVLSEEEKKKAEEEKNKPWYEKIMDRALWIIPVAIIGAAAVRGLFTRQKTTNE